MSEWSTELPNEQCLWWWYHDPEQVPIPVSITYSGTDGSYFASLGQHGWSQAQSVKEMGGYWMKVDVPEPPADVI